MENRRVFILEFKPPPIDPSAGPRAITALWDAAPRVVIHETNMRTDPETFDTDIVLQFRGRRPIAFRISKEDGDEFVERWQHALIKAGYVPE